MLKLNGFTLFLQTHGIEFTIINYHPSHSFGKLKIETFSRYGHSLYKLKPNFRDNKILKKK